MSDIPFFTKPRTALVTGATRGIGKAIADLLESVGCSVIRTGTKPVSGASNYLQLDLTSPDIFLLELNKISKLDILINNAGIVDKKNINDQDDLNWEKMININVTGAMKLTRAAAKVMRRTGSGKIVNISSMFGQVARDSRVSYITSKTALIGLTRASALDLAKDGILVNALCPGFTYTEMSASMLSKSQIEELSKNIPMGRFAETNEIAQAALFLCADWNSYMTGQCLVVDGGYTAW